MDPAWVQAIVAVAQFFAAIALIGVTVWYVQVTNRMAKAQVEPVVEMEFDVGKQEVVLWNSSIESVVDTWVNADTILLVDGKPIAAIGGGRRLPGVPSAGWWTIGTLAPGQSASHAISDLVQNAVGLDKLGERQIVAKESSRPEIVITFRATFYRNVDRKRYTTLKRIFLHVDDQGKTMGWPEDLMPRSMLNEPLPALEKR